MFDPGGFTGRLRACPFLGTSRALLCGEVVVRALDEAAAFFAEQLGYQLAGEEQANRLPRTYSG